MMHNLAASILSTNTVPCALWSTVHAKLNPLSTMLCYDSLDYYGTNKIYEGNYINLGCNNMYFPG